MPSLDSSDEFLLTIKEGICALGASPDTVCNVHPKAAKAFAVLFKRDAPSERCDLDTLRRILFELSGQPVWGPTGFEVTLDELLARNAMRTLRPAQRSDDMRRRLADHARDLIMRALREGSARQLYSPMRGRGGLISLYLYLKKAHFRRMLDELRKLRRFDPDCDIAARESPSVREPEAACDARTISKSVLGYLERTRRLELSVLEQLRASNAAGATAKKRSKAAEMLDRAIEVAWAGNRGDPGVAVALDTDEGHINLGIQITREGAKRRWNLTNSTTLRRQTHDTLIAKLREMLKNPQAGPLLQQWLKAIEMLRAKAHRALQAWGEETITVAGELQRWSGDPKDGIGIAFVPHLFGLIQFSELMQRPVQSPCACNRQPCVCDLRQ